MDVVGSILNPRPSVLSTEVKATQLHLLKKTEEEPDFKKKFDRFSEKVFVCGICGNKYTDNKVYRNHRNGHRRHKSERVKKALNSNDKKNECLTKGMNEFLPIKLGEYVDTFTSSVDDSNPSSTQQMEVSGDQPFCNSDSQQKKNNPPEKKSFYKCDICTRIFNKRSTYTIHKTKHLKEKEINTQQMEAPGDQPSSNSDSHLEKKNPPEKKSSYKCDVCDRIFTKKNTYKNHKRNHNYNKNTAKHLFFKRGFKKIS